MKMTELKENDFATFRKISTTNYAETRLKETGQSHEHCRAQALKEFNAAFANGAATPNQFVWLVEESDGAKSGYIWFGIKQAEPNPKIFIYDFMIYEKWRKQGRAKFIMQWLEQKAAELQINQISLHVLAANKSAIALYEGQGYSATNIYMAKKL